MKIVKFELDNIENVDCIKATIEDGGQHYQVLEWVKNLKDAPEVERVDSHIRINDDIGDLDLELIHDLLDEILTLCHKADNDTLVFETIGAGVFLESSKSMIAQQKNWPENDEAINIDFWKYPYWITTDDAQIIGGFYTIQDVIEYLGKI